MFGHHYRFLWVSYLLFAQINRLSFLCSRNFNRNLHRLLLNGAWWWGLFFLIWLSNLVRNIVNHLIGVVELLYEMVWSLWRNQIRLFLGQLRYGVFLWSWCRLGVLKLCVLRISVDNIILNNLLSLRMQFCFRIWKIIWWFIMVLIWLNSWWLFLDGFIVSLCWLSCLLSCWLSPYSQIVP